MSYTPVPAGGIEPPRDGATTRCLPTWLSRRNLVAEAGIEPAADEAYETSALPTELFRGVKTVSAPLILDVVAHALRGCPSWIRTKASEFKARCPTS